MREAALLPPDRLGQDSRAEPSVVGLGKGEHHGVVALREARVAHEPTIELTGEFAVHEHEVSPHRPLGLVDRGHLGHDSTLPTSASAESRTFALVGCQRTS